MEDSGDEGVDLSDITHVKVKEDPYDFTDAADLTMELREYTVSAMEVLQAAMGEDSGDEDMEPPLPSCEAIPVAEKVEEKLDVVEVPEHSPDKTVLEVVETLPKVDETHPSKSFTSFQKSADPLSMQEVEERLKYLKYFARKKQRFVLFCFSGSL